MNEHPLLTEFPLLSGKLARIPLGSFPTKVERLAKLERRLGVGSLWIKRDDLSGELHGGNKVRKLEYLLADPLLRAGVPAVAYGPLSSNWTLAFAVYARRLGIAFDLHLFAMRGREVKVEQVLLQREIARTCREYSSALRFSPWLLRLALGRRRDQVVLMPAGGSSPISLMGYVNAFLELLVQTRDGVLPLPDAIVLPLGTGGTAAGLAAGAAYSGTSTRIIGVRVASRLFSNGYTARRLARGGLRHHAEKTGSLPDLPKGLLRIDHRFSGNGYGLATREGAEAARILEGEEGIHLDPTYTAKAFACLLARCRQGWGRGMHVLYWHTLNSVPLARTRALLGLGK